MVVLSLAALLALAPMQDRGPGPAPAPPPAAPQQEAVDLGEVTVTGRSLDSLIRQFVHEVAAPNRNRGIARWNRRICVGVANLRTEPAQYIVDRVSTVASDLGVEPGGPGCTPNVIIVASDDPDGLSRTLVESRRAAFRTGGSGMDRGRAALDAFVESDAPVRWWQVSMPTDSATGGRAVRIPGDCATPCLGAMDFAPVIHINGASRLTTQIIDYIFRTVIVLDVDQVSRVSGEQLADYVAMVTLAQIDPQADTSRYATILNVFDDPTAPAGLTDWDKAYLTGLYSAERARKNLRAGRTEIADSIHRAHRDLHAAADE
jgi:hypothetical protein